MSLTRTLGEVRNCQICVTKLPFSPRPVLQLASAARILIVGQAPGRKAHHSGIPWSDASGDRLRDWLKLDRSDFYDAARIAILPIGFCYPGAGGNGGDNPPRPECAPLWHKSLLTHLPNIQLTLLIGQYAQRYYLQATRKASVTETVRAYSEYTPRFFPLPHPSWRSRVWMQNHRWFEDSVMPDLRKSVRRLI